ncbi:hypothetical protein EJ08DRAFT_652684 [Tothia fuscella]|uniref:CENP-V/GFA domain-containing protein n=1 Tax=Tothia fuscella TaxID=1048955 RepID=A0A9P4TV68_9PEZI|nr:hypothetical protein EJ08DRAFT_652684 [Tothia fuscella]
MAESKSSQVYKGSCHCGANAYTCSVTPPLDDPESKVINCNCSLCTRNGYLLVFVEDVKWTKGSLEELTVYKWNTGKFPHYFCPSCGTSLAGQGPDKLAFNVRAFHDIDLKSLNLLPIDGKSQ